MKKILCFILCLMMIIPTSFSLAVDDAVISTISVSVTAPKAGATTATDPVVTVSTSSHCRLDGAFWIADDYIDTLPPNITFEAGKVYNIGIVCQANEGYTFNAPKIQASGAVVAADFSPQVFNDSQRQMVAFVVKVTAQPAEKVTLKKLKSVKLKALSAKKLEISWKKLSKKEQKKIQKIEIQYSTDKTFQTGMKTKWAKKTKSSYTIKGLKKNTKYYVRIRAWKKDGNIIYVSKWVTKNKKTKKK